MSMLSHARVEREKIHQQREGKKEEEEKREAKKEGGKEKQWLKRERKRTCFGEVERIGKIPDFQGPMSTSL